MDINNTFRDFLIIEPNEGSKSLFSEFFRLNDLRASYNIVGTVEEALYLINKQGFKYKCCIVSVDFNKEYNGYEALRLFTNLNPSIVLIASGVVDKEAYIKLNNYPIEEFFKKDFTAEKNLYNKIFFLKYIKNIYSVNRLKLKVFIDSKTSRSLNLDRVLNQFNIKYEVDLINIEINKDLTEKYKIQAIPTIIREKPQPFLHFLGEFTGEKEILALIG